MCKKQWILCAHKITCSVPTFCVNKSTIFRSLKNTAASVWRMGSRFCNVCIDCLLQDEWVPQDEEMESADNSDIEADKSKLSSNNETAMDRDSD